MWTSISDIVIDLAGKITDEDKSMIRETKATDMIKFHHGFGTFIRNNYGLWTSSPLTEKWRNDPDSRDIRNGCDYSDDHPDAVSSKILDALWTYLTDKTK